MRSTVWTKTPLHELGPYELIKVNEGFEIINYLHTCRYNSKRSGDISSGIKTVSLLKGNQ